MPSSRDRRTHTATIQRTIKPGVIPSASCQSAQVGMMPRNQLPVSGLEAHDVLWLQRKVGNRAVQQMLKQGPQRSQRQLRVGPIGDRYEAEADQVAEMVTTSKSPKTIQRKPGINVARTPNQNVIQRDDFVDRAKTYKDPRMLKEHRSKKKVLPAGGIYYPYDATTDTIGTTAQTTTADIALYYARKKVRRNDDGTKTTGYLDNNPPNVWIPAEQLVTRKGGYVERTENLFPLDETTGARRLPNGGDVLQGAVGDCYLEAALTALAMNTPEFVQQMMRDNGETVTVRLYEVNRKDPENPIFTPRYITVNKSTAQSASGKELYQKGRLWVAMIQKAYAAGGFDGRGKRSTWKRGSMKRIDGGWASRAMEVLTGRQAERLRIDKDPVQLGKGRKLAALPWSIPEIEQYDQVAVPEDNYTGLVSFDILKDKELVKEWMEWVKGPAHQAAIEDIFYQQRVERESQVRLEHFLKLFQDTGLKNEIKLPMIEHLRHYFPMKRGTGFYTDKQREYAKNIRDSMQARKMVVVSTKNKVGRTVSGLGHSAGEKKSKGLAGPHEYTVTGVKQEDRLIYIRLRNPWGSYGREYEQDGTRMKAKENKDMGSFWLELSDLTKRFDAISTGG